jgi:pimeloyl-ACP methyl ester carboxylesterase
MPVADVNGQQLYYESTGDGPAVVFSHGFLGDHTVWDPQVAGLADEFRCIRWDARGFGETRFQDEPFDMWDAAGDVFALMDYLGIENATLVGTSQGGYISMRAALLSPDRVKALVLISTQADAMPQEAKAATEGMFGLWATEGPGPDLTAALASSMFGADERLAQQWAAKWQSWPKERIRRPGAASVGVDSIVERLAEITAPTLVLHGSADVVFPIELAEQLRDNLGSCVGLTVVDGGTHAANVTRPDAVTGELREFLRKYG